MTNTMVRIDTRSEMAAGETPEALVETLLQFYEDSGFDEIMPVAELRAGFGDLLADVGLVIAELNSAENRGVTLDKAVFDAERFPHLTRVHGYFIDIERMELPEEFIAWAPRMASLAKRDPTRIFRIVHILWAMMGQGNRMHRLLGRLAVFEMLCVGVRLSNRMSWPPQRGPHPFESETPSDLVEGLAQNELEKIDASPDYEAELGRLLDPTVVPATMMQVLFNAHHDDLAESLAFINAETYRQYERRQHFVQVMGTLPPDQAVLFRRHYAPIFGESRPTYAHLQRQHPVLLGSTSLEALRTRTKRHKDEWERLIASDITEIPEPWQGQTLDTVLARIEEED